MFCRAGNQLPATESPARATVSAGSVVSPYTHSLGAATCAHRISQGSSRWLMAGDNGTVQVRYALYARQAPLAQSAERLHGKEKVYGSIP